ncbi:LOW QUALITY PROTEIN: xaa-Pro dipeptidase [Arachis ipaensis]|uniref:LOW QUALITY PROTEIN: xaa-Pro dipeptidase n=1 Tax=Arachis ipaensis TaxID=130454 RepID=UPI000A2B001E|nr:LOW QUALITY PROTEIN: xaa-Pro dipeptidase [Arachis ipaensis]
MASSLSPPKVPMELHVGNRQKLLESLRQHLLQSSLLLRGFVLLQGGQEQTRHDTDHLEPFRQESYFAYLFGVREPGFYGAIDVESGESILFAPRLPDEYAVWLGEIKPLSYLKEHYMVSTACFTDEIASVLQERYKGSGKPLLFLLHGLNTDSNNFSTPADFEVVNALLVVLIKKWISIVICFHWCHIISYPIMLLHLISVAPMLFVVIRDDMVVLAHFFLWKLEIALIQYANDISSEAHVEIMRKAKVGMKEYQLESMFLHHTYMYGGCRHCSYTCICATGDNSAVLHYGHAAAPNDKTLEDGGMALLDMGNMTANLWYVNSHFMLNLYFSVQINRKFTIDQSLIYNAVLDAHNAVISAMKPGVFWVDMHILAERVILEALKKGQVVVGDVDEMVPARLGAVFMPHGLGHFLGLDTHDPGGYIKGLERRKEPGLKSLRTVRELQEGMVITVEPGCYFINALLCPAMNSPETSKFINQEVIKRFNGFGGVRIESDVLVTAAGCYNMTKCPREIKEIEAVMAGAPWPIKKTLSNHVNENSSLSVSS